MKKSTWYFILISFAIIAIAYAAQTDWSNGDTGLEVRTALQANDTELYGTFASYMLLAGSNTVTATNTFSGINSFTGALTIGKLTNFILSDGTETMTANAFAFAANRTLDVGDYDAQWPAESLLGSTGILATDAQVVNTITSFSSPTTANPYTLTATNSYNTKLYYGATGEVDLPALADGMAVVIYNTGAFTITIDPNGSEVVVRDGTAQTGGVSFTLSSGAGNFVCIISDGTQWVTLGFKGTLAVGT